MLSDIEIAQSCTLKPIEQIARKAGIAPDLLEPYGRHKAKVDYIALQDKPLRGKLVLVTAINPTPAGEGKTTVSIGLADALNLEGHNVCLALREPSLGPVFGVKGGAAGGGYAQVVPMEDINLHFTGDMHAITAANNLIAAMLDNSIQQGNPLHIDPRRVTWKRCMDMNDRQLRSIIGGLGGKANGTPREDGFDITTASEIMATLCLAASIADLKARVARIVVGRTYDDKPVTAGDLGAQGAVTALLKDALRPNLVQTLIGTPAFVHGGPFANIAHGCNSVVATLAAMKLGEYAITEAGFGSDLGAEKFYDIKCRHAGLRPAAVVLVTSLKALKWHGGVALPEIGKPNMEALKAGLCNLDAHVANLKAFGPEIVVSMNHFYNDPEDEIAVLRARCEELGVRFAISDGFAKGGEGAESVAKEVLEAAAASKGELHFTVEDEDPIAVKVEKIAKRVYGAGSVSFSEAAKKDLKTLTDMGFGNLPVCIAKTPFSLTADPKALGAPKGFDLPVQRVILNAGAGFAVVTTGAIMRMPGLPKAPAAMHIDVKDGKITGLA